MRKIFKKFTAVVLAATMVMGMSVNSFAALYTGDTEISDMYAEDLAWAKDDDGNPAGNVVATLATSAEMLPTDELKKHEWQPDDSHNIMNDSGIDNIKCFNITVPSKADCDEYAAENPTNPTSVRRFQICVYNYDTTGGWDPILYGRPDLVGDSKKDSSGCCISNLSAFFIQDEYLEDEEYEATLYFDMDTYTIAIYKGTGAPTKETRVGFNFYWTSYNDQEEYGTVDELSNMNVGEYESNYLTSDNADDRIKGLEAMGITTSDTLPDFATLLSDLQYTLEDTEVEGTYTDSSEADEIDAHVQYKVHVQKNGWMDYVSDGETAGTVGERKRLEGICINLVDADGNDLDESLGTIEYSTHVQKYGWMDYVADNEMSGTSGEGKRIEAIRIRLTDKVAEAYDVYYRVQAQKFGWLGWAKNDEEAGTTGYGCRLEAIQIKLVEKGGEAPSNGTENFMNLNAYYDKNEIFGISYRTHIQSYGWQDYVTSGNMSGTEGKAKRLEGIKIKITENNTGIEGGIKYRTHVQKYGWMDYVVDDEMSGTSGEAKRLEAIQIELTGDLADYFDVYYRVHAQKFGWMGWAKNGEEAGTAGYSYRLEGIQIQLAYKDTPAPGSTDGAYKSK